MRLAASKYLNLVSQFFPQKEWATAIAVMQQESGGNTNAYNLADFHGGLSLNIPRERAGDGNIYRIGSYGLFQVAAFAVGGAYDHIIKKYWRQALPKDPRSLLYIPIVNIALARQIFTEGGWSRWGAYTDGNYKKYLKDAKRDTADFIKMLKKTAGKPAKSPVSALDVKVDPKPIPKPETPQAKADLARRVIEDSIEVRTNEVKKMELDDQAKVYKQKARNTGFLAIGSGILYAFLEALQPDLFAFVGDAVGHQYLDNLFTVVLPSGLYWVLNNYAFSRDKTGTASAILTPLLIGVGDKKYKELKDIKQSEIKHLRDVLKLL